MEAISGISNIHVQNLMSPVIFLEENKHLPENRQLEQLAKKIETGEIETAGPRGLNFLQELFSKSKNREILQDLGEHEVNIPILSFHVPPGGSGHLSIKNIHEQSNGFNLNLLGFGLGQGKKISFSIDTDFGERKKCFLLINKVRIKITEVQSTSERKRKYLQSDILQIIESGVDTPEICPYCYALTAFESVPDFLPINLKNEVAGISQQRNVTLNENKDFEFGFEFPFAGVSISPKILIRRMVQTECNINYSFPGGFLYRPCLNTINKFNDLPFWRKE